MGYPEPHFSRDEKNKPKVGLFTMVFETFGLRRRTHVSQIRINDSTKIEQPSPSPKDIEEPVQCELPTTSSHITGRQFISDFKPVAKAIRPQPADNVMTHPGVAIFDVSTVKPSRIEQPPQDQAAEPKPSTRNEWTRQLVLPYERHNLRVPQLRNAVYAVYARLATYIDSELKKRGTSLTQLMSIPQDEHGQYTNVLYTIFCIAEGHVTEHYSAGARGYNNSFSYNLLQRRTSEEFVNKVKAYAEELAKHLPPGTEEIRHAFGLTSNGLPITWWDADGYLRAHAKLDESHERILNATPPRTTKLFDIPEVRLLIFRHYFKALDSLNKQRHSAPDWNVRISKYLSRVFDSTNRHIDTTPYHFLTLNHLLKLSEQAIRKYLPYTRPLNTENELELLKKTIPKQAARAVIATISQVGPLTLSEATLEKLALQSPTAWKYDLEGIETKSLDDILGILKRYKSNETRRKMASTIMKNHPDVKARLAAAYVAEVAADNSAGKSPRKSSPLIHPEQRAAFQKLVLAKKEVSLDLVGQLFLLTKAPRRTVILDDHAIERAHADYDRAIKSVVGYLGEEAEEPVLEIDPTPTVKEADQPIVSAVPFEAGAQLSEDQKEFLRMISDQNEGLSLPDAAIFAKLHGKLLNGYVQAINKTLYELFEDQVILQTNGNIVIEKEYSESVKELI